ncbi:HrpE/YscL family type III secretion apparatus protein [Endozoicomonas sp. OPT23]|uniref:HrpE/YscL family type III secretion apparatus protein n=1 Tax=Endozoicomonas sp. OPT23 TaxID=2072845 RepID=UPI00129A3B2E|nr:HrpE/YscL family type III secretion apparatus protein [Endozoicomonas sp. OPT23]MRI32165.1 HrpE/YscL family type III secretion apparatus protein [Endozoicomonas sp. OPT23]
MASPVILTAGRIQLDPAARVLKAAEYAEYLQAQEILAQANRQAEEILQKAAEVYETKKQQGYDEGIDISRKEQSEHMLKVVSRTIGYLSDVEKALAGILMSGVKKIIGEFDQDEMAVNLVRNALQHVRNEKQVTIRIPPSQFNMVKSRVNEILAEYKGVGFIDLVSDERLSTGDCIMESDIGVVDASVDLQLDALQKRFEKLNSEAVSTIARDTTMLE